jgi:hypothetical protein
VEPDVVPAGLLPSVSGEDVEAMCAERSFSVLDRWLVYRRGEKGRTNGREAAAGRGRGHGVRTEIRGDAGCLEKR